MSETELERFVRENQLPRWAMNPDGYEVDPDELTRALAFIPAQLERMDAPTSDEERADLERRLKVALMEDWRSADWLGVKTRLEDGGLAVSAAPTAEAYARVWPAVVRGWLIDHAPAVAARYQLRVAKDKGSTKATAPHAFDVLKSSVSFRWKGLTEVIGDAPDERTSAKVADFLTARELPDGAKAVAEKEYDAKRWSDLLFAARVLARVTWKYETEALMSGASHPAVSLPVVTILATARRAQGELFGNEWSLLAEKPQGRGKTSHPIGKVAGVSAGLLTLLDDSTLLDLAIFMVNQVHRQRITREMYGHPGHLTDNVDKLVVVGGWPALTKALELPESMRGRVADAADLFAALRLNVQGLGESSLFQWNPLRAKTNPNGITRAVTHRGGGQSRLELTLLGPLGSYYVHRLDPVKHDRALSPVPLWQQPPPLPGRKNDRAGLKMLMLLLLRHFRENAESLATVGGVEINRATWGDLLDEAKLRPSILPTMLKGWTEGFNGRPAVLTEKTGGVYDLAPAHKPERDFILESYRAGRAKRAAAAIKAKSRKGRAP